MIKKTKQEKKTKQTDKRIIATSYSAPSDKKMEQNNADTILDSNSSIDLTSSPWWHSQFKLMLMVFALLGLAAILFITLLPSPSANLTELPLSKSSSTLTNTSAGGDDETTPWDDARRAQARTNAQGILSNLLDSKKFLEEKGIQDWAADEFNHALQLADQGDELYQQQDYQSALESYQSSVDSLDVLYQQIPVYVQSKIVQGQRALENGTSQLAHDAFAIALEIEPNNFEAMNGLNRAKILDQVLLLSQAAEQDQQLFVEQDDKTLLMSAQEKLNTALNLDQQNEIIKAQLGEVEVLQNDKQYRDAMSDGFAALFANKFNTANTAFGAALKIQPDDNTARLAYQQSLAANKTSSLQSVLNRAKQFETNEEWQNALSNYKEVLSRDSNQVQAKLGEIRSNARYQLDSQLRNILSDQLALSKAAPKLEAQQLLADAKAIRSAGNKLSNQIRQLEDALKATDASIKVQISSDSITEVTLTKEGASRIQLGRFSNKNLALKPGRYVLTGVRFGYRDVRKEIDLYPNESQIQTLELKCDQPISANLQEANNGPA